MNRSKCNVTSPRKSSPPKTKIRSPAFRKKFEDAIETRGETIFRRYMKRRPSLNLTPRSYDFFREEPSKNYETITDFRTEKVK